MNSAKIVESEVVVYRFERDENVRCPMVNIHKKSVDLSSLALAPKRHEGSAHLWLRILED